MKKVLFGLLFIISASSFAATPEAVCLSMDFDSSRSECIEIISSGYISPVAADVCQSLDFDSGKNACLVASLNKEYSSGSAEICKKQSFDSGAVTCMENAGKAYVDDAEASAIEKLRKIQDLAKKAKRQLKNGNALEALVTIGLIIEYATIDEE